MINDSFIGKENLSEEDLFDLKELVKLVIYRHFNKYIGNDAIYNDLFSIGMEVCLKTITKGNFIKGKSRLFSYLYTGVRNYIGNYLSKTNKIVLVGDEQLEDLNQSSDINYNKLYISDNDILINLGKLIKNKTTLINIKSYLRYIGFTVENEVLIPKNKIDEVDKEIALLLWKILQ